VGLQFDGQPSKSLAVRAGLEGWWRTVEQDRFTNPVLNLATGRFEGVREPRHLEQPQQAVAAQLEATLRFRAAGAEHKLMGSASTTWGRYTREERSLTTAERNALPVDVRTFDPAAPNFHRPAFNDVVYGRINTDRDERARYSSVEASDRLAWKRGRVVATAGLRYDEVDLEVTDRKPGASIPLTRDRTAQLSYHGGLNWQVVRNKLLAFANTSTAFDPSTPVDARTGRIQDNETTLGYETGLRGRALGGRLDYAASGYLLYNRHIARRNPLYNDPVADANQTQPQLVASGEERFSGGRLELKWTATKTLVFSLKGVFSRAITTASPDLPQETGRPITRLPSYTVSANLRYRPPANQPGFTWGAGWQYLDGFVANYEDSRRDFLDYPGYGLVNLSSGYQWRWGTRQLQLEGALRNAFDRDLLASLARVGAGRELTVSARLVF
jgi:iron complex outermembrane recepter protein